MMALRIAVSRYVYHSGGQYDDMIFSKWIYVIEFDVNMHRQVSLPLGGV